MKQNATLRFCAASLCLGAIAFWASENFFWSAPPDDFSYLHLPLLWMIYSLASACGLAAVMLTGIRGWKALFLGGAIMGFMIEGAVAGTMFQAFPLQLVWTPLAWDALISSLIIFGLCRVAGKVSVLKLIAGWLAVGCLGATFATYWPTERPQMPGPAATLTYLAGVGLVVPVANMALDKIGPLTLPPRWALFLPLALLALGWAFHLFTTLSPIVICLPLLLALTLWIMQRLGTTAGPLCFEASSLPWHHALFMLAPLTTTALASISWTFLPGQVTNILVALVGGAISLVIFLLLAGQAIRLRKS